MNILNTDIIKSTQDVFWEEISQIDGFGPKPVLILSAAYESGSSEEDQLNAIIKAGCKLTEQQYNLVLLNEYDQVSWRKLREDLHPKVVLLFNISLSQLGIAALLRINELNNFDSCFWVPTISLERLAQDKELKGYLWNNALKPLFVTKTHGEIV